MAAHFQPCAVAKLLSAIYGLPLPETFRVVGLHPCPCGRAATHDGAPYPYCSTVCEKKYVRMAFLEKVGGIWIQLVCEECEREFSIRRSYVESRGLRGKPMPRFCGNTCRGKWAGRTFGFAVSKAWRPKNTHCKYGHLMQGANLYYSQLHSGPKAGTWVRYCRTCLRRKSKEKYRRKRRALGYPVQS